MDDLQREAESRLSSEEVKTQRRRESQRSNAELVQMEPLNCAYETKTAFSTDV